MFFHTVTCTCGWSIGPSKKSYVKNMLALHKEIHRLEDEINKTTG